MNLIDHKQRAIFYFLVSVILLLSGIVYFLNLELERANERLVIAKTENARQADELRVEMYNFQVLQKEYSLLKNKDVLFFEWVHKSDASQRVNIYLDKSLGQVYVSVQKLQPLQDKQYQLWVKKGNTYTSAGVFEAGLKGVQKLKKIDVIGSFEISEEPFGGSSQPTSVFF